MDVQGCYPDPQALEAGQRVMLLEAVDRCLALAAVME